MTSVTAVTSTREGLNLLHTARGTIKSQKVIFGDNAYTADLLPQFHIAIIPVKGMASHVVPESPVHAHLSNTYNVDFGIGVHYLNPRPDGSIVVGGGKWKWKYSDRPDSWFDNYDDSKVFLDGVHENRSGYMQRNFLVWGNSKAEVESTWVGVMGYTKDEWPFVGLVPGDEGRWILAGLNGSGMALILTAAKAAAQMVRTNCEFGDAAPRSGCSNFLQGQRREAEGV